jgi:starch synthase (maltosyl-transferring)
MSSVYGIYSGYELCENEAIPGGEEYFNSEKYEIKVRDWDQPGNITDFVATINRIRRANPALHLYRNLRFYQAGDDNVLFYGKQTADRSNAVLIAANLDPFQPHSSTLRIPLHELGIGDDETYEVQELLGGARYLWKGEAQSVTLDPNVEPAAIFSVHRWPQKDYDEPCY